MKIDRRSFISLGVGVVAGTTLTPVPWKLMDDISIWTQNWPWTPVPKEGADTYKTSVCTLCPGGCGIQVRKIMDRAVKIDGLPEHPINRGTLCPLGLSGLQFLYGPSRVKAPMKRVGKRGEGKWQEISWDEAVSAVTKKLKELREKEKPHSVAWVAGTDKGTVPRLIGRFLTAYGSPNFIRPPSVHDAYELAVYLMQGQEGAVGFDIENADHVLSFGTGLLQGWGAPVRMLNIYGEQHDSRKIVQIETRLSDTAAKADQWVPINPGTEGALALGIAHVMIKESLYDQSFINQSVFGFEDWTDDHGTRHIGFKTLVREDYSPETVAEKTGVPKATIEKLARRFARADKPIAISGRGEGLLPGSLSECMAVHSLNALVGNINKPGGVSVTSEPEYAKWPEVNIDMTASRGMQQPRVDGAGGSKYPNARYLLHRLPEVINSAKGESPVQALFVSDANPLYTLPNTKATKAAFDRIPFLVSFSSFMDETASHSDYILPNHVFLERYEDVPTPSASVQPIIGLAKPVVRPVYNTRHVGDVVLQVAKSLGSFVEKAFPWKDYQGYLKSALKDYWDQLEEKGFVKVKNAKDFPWANRFNTATGKFEFYPSARNQPSKNDKKALPNFSPVPIEGKPEQYPLVLMPYDAMRLTSGDVGNPPFMTKTIDDTVLKGQTVFVEINPATARKIGASEGERATVATPRGRAKVRLHLFEGIAPGVIAMPKGFGHTAYSKYLAGKGVNFNDLIGPISDPLSGLNTAWGIRAKIDRA
ncbi:MAG: molybdopterin-dependent oxidoreductase [Desulfobacterales bacterium]|nr:molybdopterin-dependent oxidoreductase [Desulfobacterales bacterium]